jgi:hypothetical protein
LSVALVEGDTAEYERIETASRAGEGRELHTLKVRLA